MILVLDNYDSFTWNLVHYLMELGAEPTAAPEPDVESPEAVEVAAPRLRVVK